MKARLDDPSCAFCGSYSTSYMCTPCLRQSTGWFHRPRPTELCGMCGEQTIREHGLALCSSCASIQRNMQGVRS